MEKGNSSGVKGGVKSRGPIEIDTCWLPNSLTLSKGSSEEGDEGMRHGGYNVAPVVCCRPSLVSPSGASGPCPWPFPPPPPFRLSSATSAENKSGDEWAGCNG